MLNRALDHCAAAALPTLTRLGVDVDDEGVLVRRAGDRDARDSGQFGRGLASTCSIRWTPSSVSYFMNYHSRAPIFSATGALCAATFAEVRALPAQSASAGAASLSR